MPTAVKTCSLILCSLSLCALRATPTAGQAPVYGAPPYGTASPGFPTTTSPPAASLGPGIQPFDPYALPPGAPSTAVPGTTGFGAPAPGPPGFGAPTLPPAPPPTSWPAPGLTNPTSPYPAPPPTMFGTPPPTSPYGAPAATPYGAPATPYGATPYGATPYGGPAQPVTPPPYQRLFGNTGFRNTWVMGNGDGDEMGTYDLEISTTLNCANFFGSAGGMRITPGFVFTWLNGPSAPIESDMPARLYSAYVDFGWNPVLSPTVSGEINFRPGVYSDFQTVTTESVRLIGSGIGIIQLSPTSALKLGAIYIDRADVKLLPAFGVLITPNQQSRWDLFFPSPRVSHYWKTINNGQLWWYIGGEYGGGSWTMDRPEPPSQGASETVDINDIRVFVGAEWFNLNRCYGFFDFGYVFERELYYVVEPGDRTPLSDTFMLRAGLSF